MDYGCIGMPLGHSFSREVHEKIGLYPYSLSEIRQDELAAFFGKRDFRGINVTIPYKTAVLPFLDEVEKRAAAIGAVNTVVNEDGRLIGYNTDFSGLSALAERCGIGFSGKKVLILGTGGTSKTAIAVSKELGAGEIIRVSRTPKDGACSYECAVSKHADADIIINTTPVGMFPDNNGIPIDIACFKRLSGVLDAVYNPTETRLIKAARERGIPSEGGLYMLVFQAVSAAEIFTGKKLGEDTAEKIYEEIYNEKKTEANGF